MNDPRDHVPAYRTIRVTTPQTPAAVAAEIQAWQARDSYPDLAFAGPVFGVVCEREEGGWEVLGSLSGLAPQDARDSMGSVFRRRAQQAEQSGDQAIHAECMAAAERMDWEAIDEQSVLGTRYRVLRVERFILTGPNGPEPPRPADTGPGDPGQREHTRDQAEGAVIDPVTATGMAGGILTTELLTSTYPADVVPAEVRDDSVRAGRTHPGGVLLPPAFAIGEQTAGRWRPVDEGISATPAAARDHLVGYLRVTVPWQLGLNPADRAVYAAAAERLEDQQPDELRVAGRRFRIVHVERLARIGPDGPEGPRPSDPDPQPPVMVQTGGHDLAAGQDTPIELDDGAKRFLQLFHEEEARRKARAARRETQPLQQPGP